jgi:hypothetical protein
VVHGRCVVSAIYRLSPQGVLAKRDLGRASGWTEPHWRVVDVAPGDHHHYITQLLTDAAVESWAVLAAVREKEREVAR